MSTESSPARGTEIGHYRIEAVLGRGGMGVVYRATDARLGRKVALKVLPPEYGDDQAFRARFLRESRLAASIDHPGVIPIYEAGDAGGRLFIAMRHVDGIDLGELLRREGALDPARALALVAQLAAALDAAHALGLVHRDVKPSNALVARQGDAEHVYLSDFGLSKELVGDATLSGSGGFVGTVRYMAPEVIRSGQADARSDLYSLGCLLFECFTGTAPFDGPSEAAVIYGHLEEPPPRASDRRPGLPRALDAVLARALDKDPERRWASGAELMHATRAALAGEAPRARDGIRRRAMVLGLAAVALAAGVVVLARDSGSGPSLASVRANGVAVIDPGEAALTAQVALDGAPSEIAAGAGAVWVTDEDRGVVARVDKKTFTIRQTITVGHGPSALAVEPRGVWVANRQDGTVSVISPQTNTVVKTIPVGRNVDGVCIGSGSVWVASPLDYAVVRLDPESLRKTDTVRLDTQPAQLACGNGVVWASSPSSGTVTEINAKAAATERTVQVSRGASAIALGADAVWVTNAPDGTVSRIDPRRGIVTALVPVGVDDGPADLAVTEEAVWVSSEFGGTVARIDPARPQAGVVKLRVGNRPQGLAVVDGALWVGIADTGARHRGGTLRLESAFKMPWTELDPSTSYGTEGWELLGLTNDGLTGFRRQGGGDSAALVANLAVALPTPSEGGRRYAFRLRRGTRYSTGEPVRASDVRFAIERALRHHAAAPGLFAGIRGARACTPKRCDLSRGIVTDDAAGTVVFRLTEPDSDLLTKLARPFAAVLPPSAGVAAPAKRALPATGPYVIAEFKPGRFVRLERNPRFKSWSRAARPDGYPDAITARFGAGGRAAVNRVLAGRADRIQVDGLPAQLPSLRRRAPAQLHASVIPATWYFVLNTRRAPFDSLDARRAVAYAFDRRAAVIAKGGRDVAQENCQILPPNFPGSRPYCPYTTGTAGARGRPDLARARRLVRRSGTTGMRVTVVVAESFLPTNLDQQMKRTLVRLGYDATLRVLPDDKQFQTLNDTSKRAQIGLWPWAADYPGASTFLHNFSCDALTPNSPDNLNPSQFCDREVDRLMTEAARLQAVDPDAADAAWARAERRIVDQAPAVGAYSNIFTDLVSQRLGNYQYNPGATGMVLDQAWVR